MELRTARHTRNLLEISKFYTQLLGLEVLGSFINHDGYDGVMLGLKGSSWHIEFTYTGELHELHYNSDDALVFYIGSTLIFEKIKANANSNGYAASIPKNPYWQKNALQFKDPDGFNVIICQKNYLIWSKDPISQALINAGVNTWNEALLYIHKLPYGRNSMPDVLESVIEDQKGTCSSKHKLLASLARSNQIPNIDLVGGFFNMNGENTPAVKSILQGSGLSYIPEFHYFLKMDGFYMDFTNADSSFLPLIPLCTNLSIRNHQERKEVKIKDHQEQIKQFIEEQKISLSVENVWQIREECIQALSQGNYESEI